MWSVTAWIISELRIRRKNVTAPAPQLLVFMSVAPAPELSVFMAPDPAPASVRLHTLIFRWSWCASSWMENEINHLHKIRRIYQTFFSYSNWLFFTSSAVTLRKSAKQQSQVQTIQRTITSKNVTQDNANINNFWKGSRWFCLQRLRTFCYFLWQNQENCCLENYIRVRAFKHRPIPINQVFCTRMICQLQS